MDKVSGQAATLKPVFEGEDNVFLNKRHFEWKEGKAGAGAKGVEWGGDPTEVRVSGMKGHPGVRELLGWPPAGPAVS